MKERIIVDFIVDHAIVETTHNYSDLEHWRLYFNGLSHKNRSRIGILIISPKGIPTKL